MVYKLFSEGFEGRIGRKAHAKFDVATNFHIQSASTLARLLVLCIKILLFTYDILSYPIYFAIQRPDLRYKRSLHQDAKTSFKGLTKQGDASDDGTFTTINEIFAKSILKHSNNPCLGYRAVVTCPVLTLNEEGKHVLKDKSFRSDYTWYTYEQIGRRVQDIASGLCHYSIYPGSRALFLANTCLEWFIASQACFQIAAQLVIAPEITSPASLAAIIERSDVEIIFTSCDRIELLCRLFDEIKHQLIGAVKMKKIVLIDWQFSIDFSEPLFARLRDSSRPIIDQILSMGQIEEVGVEYPIELSCTKSLNQAVSERSTPALTQRISKPSSRANHCRSIPSTDPLKRRAPNTTTGNDRTESPCGFNLESWCLIPRSIDDLVAAQERNPKPGDLAMIVFTHGSLGKLKGILIDHKYLAENSTRLLSGEIVNEGEVYCSILPLDNLSEFITELGIFSSGGSIGYSCSLNTLFRDGKDLFKKDLSDIEALEPSLILARPYILERLKVSVKNYLTLQMNPVKSFLLAKVLYRYKRYWRRRHFSTPIVDRIFCTDMTNLFGKNMRHIMCDGLTDCSDTRDFFALIVNIPIREICGAEEAPMSFISALDTCYREQVESRHLLLNSPILIPTLGVRIKLEDWEDFHLGNGRFPSNGRLLVGGDVVCTGYFGSLAAKDCEAFKVDSAAVRWFRTNYIAREFSSGCIEIISDISDMIKMSDGQFISLSQIEQILRNSQFVDNVCAICGEDRNFIIALVVPNLRRLALKSPGEANLKMAIGTETEPEELTDIDFRREVCNDRLLCEFVSEHLGRLFADAGLGSLPSKFHIVPEIWTPETELVTPSFEPKRSAIQRYYAADIQSLFKMRLNRTNVRLSARIMRTNSKSINLLNKLGLATNSSQNGCRMSY